MVHVTLQIAGTVQGVGFRPHVYRMAISHNVNGVVCNDGADVVVHAEGTAHEIASFVDDVIKLAPSTARITSVRTNQSVIDQSGARFDRFTIIESRSNESQHRLFAPDVALCRACESEMLDRNNRRYQYPLISCTNCGPRYSIQTAIPFDRMHTSLNNFTLCARCTDEYRSPADRRFHSQTLSCWDCGPEIMCKHSSGAVWLGQDGMSVAKKALRDGAIIAVKGIGGFHLLADASNDRAVQMLRRNKRRDHQAFALMCRDMDVVQQIAMATDVGWNALQSHARPIVLLEKRAGSEVSLHVAPRSRYYGVLLPSTGFHTLLLEYLPIVVATSANRHGSPLICDDTPAATLDLFSLAEYVLTHDRPIVTCVDDSIVLARDLQSHVVRRARGFVHTPVAHIQELPAVLALGAELKSTVCCTVSNQLVVSEHIGDLSQEQAYNRFTQCAKRMLAQGAAVLQAIAHDLHPQFASTQYAAGLTEWPRMPIQHHHAHLASCMSENMLKGPVIGVVFDGYGIGPGGESWGGEFLVGSYEQAKRVGHLRPLRMLGGDRAVQEPYRIALTMLWDSFVVGHSEVVKSLLPMINRTDMRVFRRMYETGTMSPATTSAGRLFDGVSALLGICVNVTYEAQASIELECVACTSDDAGIKYQFDVCHCDEVVIADPCTMIRRICADIIRGVPTAAIAHAFHQAVACMVCEMCEHIASRYGIRDVCLSGGVFANALLLGLCEQRLKARGLTAWCQHVIPTGDGGISHGQAVIAGERLLKERCRLNGSAGQD